jgi:hypothetical protein
MFSKSVQHFAYFSCRERKWPFLNFEMAQLAIETLEDLYNNLTILQFWKDRPPTPFLEYVEYVSGKAIVSSSYLNKLFLV